jgi:hypothetical protein
MMHAEIYQTSILHLHIVILVNFTEKFYKSRNSVWYK